MNYSSMQSLIVSNISSFGAAALTVLTAIIAVAVGLIVFRFGFKKLVSMGGEERFYNTSVGVLGARFTKSKGVSYRRVRGYTLRNETDGTERRGSIVM